MDPVMRLESVASLVDLRIDPTDCPLVTEHLTRLLTLVALLMEFSVPEGVEPAPVFRP